MPVLKALASILGKQIGKKVVHDTKVVETYLHKSLLAKKGFANNAEYHASNINSLYRESGLSKDWISGLIAKSKSISELKAIQAYLNNQANTYNLGRDNVKLLSKKIAGRLDEFRQIEILNKLESLGVDISDLL